MTRRRRRVRSHAEQMYWDALNPSERLAFTLGFAVGQGVDFPTPAQIDALRGHLGLPTSTRGSQPPARQAFAHKGRPVARTASGQQFRYDYAEVARIAREAIADGRSPARAVFEQIEQCASEAAAHEAIRRARELGHDIPYLRARGGAA